LKKKNSAVDISALDVYEMFQDESQHLRKTSTVCHYRKKKVSTSLYYKLRRWNFRKLLSR